MSSYVSQQCFWFNGPSTPRKFFVMRYGAICEIDMLNIQKSRLKMRINGWSWQLMNNLKFKNKLET